MSGEPSTRNIVSVVIPYDKGIILVKNKGEDKWGLPGGKVDPFENIRHAAPREVSEETGFEVTLDSFIGVYQYLSENRNVIYNSAYSSKIVEGTLEIIRPEEIKEVSPFSLRDIRQLYGRKLLKTPGEAAMDSIDDYFSGRRFPLDIVKSYLIE